MKQEVYKDSTTDTLTLEVRENGLLVSPTSVTVSIYREGVVVVSSASITPATDGGCAYTVPSTVTSDLGENLRAEWQYTYSGKVRKMVQLFDVVLTKIYPLVTHRDIVEECPPLENNNVVYYGTVETGGTGTFTDNDLTGQPKNSWISATIEFLGGTHTNKMGVVTASTEAGVLTFTGVTDAVVSGETFVLRKSYQPQINKAWEELLDGIYQRGNRPSLIISVEELKLPHLYKSVSKIARGASKEANDYYWALADLYSRMYDTKMEGLRLSYDIDEDRTLVTEKTTVTGFRR